MSRSRLIDVAVLLGAMACAPLAAAQSDYPSRPIRLVLPAAPGGGADFTARTVGQKLGEALHQAVVVDNRAGADGNIGSGSVASAAPDGHTLLLSITSFPINPGLYKKMPFDTARDFAPVTLVASAPLLLVVNPSVDAKTVGDLLAVARANPGKLNYASGLANTANLAAELFKRTAGVDMVGVPYKGGGPAVVDLVAGRVQIYFSTIPAVLSHIQAGKLRGLAVTTQKRVAILPDMPTVAESGLPGFDVIGWFGLFAPAATPAAIVARLNKETNAILATPDMQERFAKQGLIPGGGTPEDLGKLLRGELSKWGTLIKELGIPPT